MFMVLGELLVIGMRYFGCFSFELFLFDVTWSRDEFFFLSYI